jgi:hypothetical protein
MTDDNTQPKSPTQQQAEVRRTVAIQKAQRLAAEKMSAADRKAVGR